MTNKTKCLFFDCDDEDCSGHEEMQAYELEQQSLYDQEWEERPPNLHEEMQAYELGGDQ
jgi:hypothetical protein